MEQFSEIEKRKYWPQWVEGQVVKTQDDHMTRFPDHYEQWLTTINPPPKSEAELTGAILAEREACIKFVSNYPTGTLLAKDIAKDLRKSQTLTAQTQPLTCQAFTVRQTCVFRTAWVRRNPVNFGWDSFGSRPRLWLMSPFLRDRRNRSFSDTRRKNSSNR
jgi:hypothetical protein